MWNSLVGEVYNGLRREGEGGGKDVAEGQRRREEEWGKGREKREEGKWWEQYLSWRHRIGCLR